MRVLVTGSTGFIGSALVKELRWSGGHEVIAPLRSQLDLLNVGDVSSFGPEVVYLCAAKTRFIDCEDDPTAYRINVDAQIEIARQLGYAKIIFLSSEAVERALHTNYGMHKALAEMGLRTVCDPIIARICGKVNNLTLPSLVHWLIALRHERPGAYRWEPTQMTRLAVV